VNNIARERLRSMFPPSATNPWSRETLGQKSNCCVGVRTCRPHARHDSIGFTSYQSHEPIRTRTFLQPDNGKHFVNHPPGTESTSPAVFLSAGALPQFRTNSMWRFSVNGCQQHHLISGSDLGVVF